MMSIARLADGRDQALGEAYNQGLAGAPTGNFQQRDFYQTGIGADGYGMGYAIMCLAEYRRFASKPGTGQAARLAIRQRSQVLG